MADGISFDIVANDKTATGVNSAINNVDRLNQHLASYKNASQEIAQLNQQYAASQNAVNTSTAKTSSTFAQLKEGWKTMLKIGAAVAATGVAVKEAWEFGQEGANVLRLSNSFKSVATSYGVSSQLILSSMRNASRGTIADTDLMLAANRAMLLGVSTNAEELGKITEVAIARGRAMGLSSAEAIDRVYTGIGRLSPKILDDLGIITNATQRYQDYAKAHDMSAEALDDFTKREIIKQAIIESSAGLLKDYSMDEAASYEMLGASWTNYMNSIKSQFASTFTGPNTWLGRTLQQSADMNQARIAYQSYLEKTGTDTWTSKYGKTYNRYTRTAIPGQVEFDRDAQRFMRQQERAALYTQYAQGLAGDLATPAAAPTAAPLDYAAIFSGGLQQQKVADDVASGQRKIQDTYTNTKVVTDLYRESVAGLVAAHRAGEITSRQLNEQLKELQKSYKDGSFAAGLQAEATRELKDSAVNAYEEIALSTLKAKDASDEQMLNFALASGQISQEARNQAMAQSRLAEAFLSGGISAKQYADNIGKIMGQVSKLDGATADAYVNIYITEYINTVYGSQGGGTQGTGASYQAMMNQIEGIGGTSPTGAQAVAAGGFLSPGVWTLVGDKPGGQLTPYSELISPTGYVFDARTTRKLMAAGVLGDFESRAFTDDSYVSSPLSGISRPKLTTPKSKGRRAGSTGGGTSASVALSSGASSGEPVVAAAVEIASSAEAAVEQSAQTQQIISAQVTAAVQAAIVKSNLAVTNKLDEMISVLMSENPRAIGAEVSGQFAKYS